MADEEAANFGGSDPLSDDATGGCGSERCGSVSLVDVGSPFSELPYVKLCMKIITRILCMAARKGHLKYV